MVILTQTNNKLMIGTQGKLLISTKSDLSVRNIETPAPNLPPNLTKGQEETIINGNKAITCICCSKNDDFIAISMENKQVVLFDSDFTVKRNFVSNRAVSKMCFTRDNNLLLADKTGDVMLYTVENEDCKVILGHLSMLLDVKLSDCERFVITCDRDEKIRISCFPNSYNVQSYCLGHKEFVTNIEVCGDLLISASGDGTVRFWDFLNGTQLSVIDTNEQIDDKSLLQRFCKQMDEDKIEVFALPIREMQVYKSKDFLIIAVTLMYLNNILLYEVKNQFPKLQIKFLRSLKFNYDILTFSLSTDLYVLTKNELQSFQLVDNDFVQNKMLNVIDKLDFNDLKSNDVSVLYKRKFDNLQEYLERKKLRLEGKQ